MPVISSFYGIIVRMYKEKNTKHNLPHIHAEYNGEYVTIDFKGNVLEGKIPNKKMQLLKAWIVIHEDELNANWNMLLNDSCFMKIKPLE